MAHILRSNNHAEQSTGVFSGAAVCVKRALKGKLNPKGRNTMKSSAKDKVEGTFHDAKGKVKEMAGKIIDDPKLEAKGKAEKIAGKVQEKVGQVKKVLGS